MPILEVEIVQPDGLAPDDRLARRIADAAGAVFGGGPGRTWVRLRVLPRSHYAENDGELSADLEPVFVSVLKAKLPSVEERRNEVRQLTERIAAECGRPTENVHVLYASEATGRLAFGGMLVEP